MRKLTHEEIVARQKERVNRPRLPVTVVLNDIRSLHNVGAIFRTCDAAGVEKIWLCGITGYPPQAQISKIALGAEEHVPWDYAGNVIDVVRKLKQEGYRIVLLEQMDESIPYAAYRPDGPVCLVVGNEKDGICGSLAGLCDDAVEVGMDGIKNSLNVSVAFGIVVYHLRDCLRNLSRWDAPPQL